MFTGQTRRIPIIQAFFTAAMVLFLALLSACRPAASLPVAASSPAFPAARVVPSLVSQINPAARYCMEIGGTVTTHIRGDGRAYGLCQFTDNRACEEWALLRGLCPVGGVRITGFGTIAQDYCAWLGGETLAVPHATCTFPDGKVCNDDALYNGMCDDPVLSRHQSSSLRGR